MSNKRAIFLNRMLLVVGLLSLLYYINCVIYAGFGISVIWIWLVAGIAGIVKGGVSLLLIKKEYLKNAIGEKNAGLLKKTGKILWIFIGFIFCVFLFTQILIMKNMYNDAEGNLDYIIVLGASVHGEKPSFAMLKRIETSFQYLEENKDTFVIASGGQGSGEDISEAECIRRELVKRGIAEDRILMETQSLNTAENIKFSYQLINKEDAKVGIVTNSFHVLRAVCIANKIGGYKIQGIPAPFRNLLLPHYMMRESLGIMADILRGHI